MSNDVILREVIDSDIPVFFEHQADEEASRMAAFPIRERSAFHAHWDKIRGDPHAVVRTILVGGAVAGNIGSYDQNGRRLVGYWIGRAFWGKGVATRALASMLLVDPARPMYAFVAQHNQGSIRVLEKCNFVQVGKEKGVSIDGGPPADEFLMMLASPDRADGKAPSRSNDQASQAPSRPYR